MTASSRSRRRRRGRRCSWTRRMPTSPAITLLGTRALEAHPNLIVGRTFAKAYGLAAIRAGALIGAPDTLAPCGGWCLPTASTWPRRWRSRRRCATGRTTTGTWRRCASRSGCSTTRSIDWVCATGSAAATSSWPASVNAAGRVLDGLRQRGIYVRDRSNDHGCAGCVRITTGVVAHTQRCIAGIEEVLCAAR